MNKYQKHKEVIIKNYPPSNYTMLREALDVSIELLDKATPKKPLNIYCGLSTQEGICPNCNKKLFEPLMELAYSKDDDLEYFTEVKLSNCNRCGQAIDWSNDE